VKVPIQTVMDLQELMPLVDERLAARVCELRCVDVPVDGQHSSSQPLVDGEAFVAPLDDWSDLGRQCPRDHIPAKSTFLNASEVPC